MTQAITRSTLLDEVVERVFAEAKEVFDAELSLIALVEGDGLRGFAAMGTDETMWRDLTIPVDNLDSPFAISMQQRDVIVAENVANSRFAGIDVAKRFGLRSLVLVPLVTSDDRIGVLMIGYVSRARSFTSEDLGLLRALGDETALAFVRARYVERLKQLDREKDEFVSMVSHELRGPLTAVKGFVSIIKAGHAGELTEQQREYFDIVSRNTERMFVLIEDLMTISRVESGRLDMEYAQESYLDVVEGIVNSVSPEISAKGIDLSVDLEPIGSVHIDRLRIEQVLSNLLSNALKYTPEGGRIAISVASEQEGFTTAIQDTGVGIPEDEQDEIFEKFFRATSVAKEKLPGTGLGLAISKAIVERHYGRIWFQSEAGAGSTFSFWLPSRPT